MREAFEDWAGADLQFAKWDGSRAIVAMILAHVRFYQKRTCLAFRGWDALDMDAAPILGTKWRPCHYRSGL
jgi:hypothetical protein